VFSMFGREPHVPSHTGPKKKFHPPKHQLNTDLPIPSTH
jgi:hypothetical protein